MKKAVVFALAIITAVAGVYYVKFHPGGISSLDARFEARTTRIPPPFPGMVADVLVKEGDIIAEGEVLFRLESDAMRETLAREMELLAVLKNSLPPGLPPERRAENDAQDAKRLLSFARQAETDARQAMEAMSDAKAQAAFALATLRARAENAGKPSPEPEAVKKALAANDTAASNFLKAKERFEQASAVRAALESEAAGKTAGDTRLQGRLLLYKAQEEKIRDLEYALDQTQVRSPHGGKVTGINIEAKKPAVPGENAVTLIPFTPETLWITALFPPASETELRPGRQCLITFPGLDGPAVSGRIDAPIPTDAAARKDGDTDAVLVRIVPDGYDEQIMGRVQDGLPVHVTLDGKPSPLARLRAKLPGIFQKGSP